MEIEPISYQVVEVIQQGRTRKVRAIDLKSNSEKNQILKEIWFLEDIRKDDIFCLSNVNWNLQDGISTATIDERANLVLFSETMLSVSSSVSFSKCPRKAFLDHFHYSQSLDISLFKSKLLHELFISALNIETEISAEILLRAYLNEHVTSLLTLDLDIGHFERNESSEIIQFIKCVIEKNIKYPPFGWNVVETNKAVERKDIGFRGVVDAIIEQNNEFRLLILKNGDPENHDGSVQVSSLDDLQIQVYLKLLGYSEAFVFYCGTRQCLVVRRNRISFLHSLRKRNSFVRHLNNITLPPSCDDERCSCHSIDQLFFSQNVQDFRLNLQSPDQYQKRKIKNFLRLCQIEPVLRSRICQCLENDQTIGYDLKTIISNLSHMSIRTNNSRYHITQMIEELVLRKKTVLVCSQSNNSCREISSRLTQLHVYSIFIEKGKPSVGGFDNFKCVDEMFERTKVFLTTFHGIESPFFWKRKFDVCIALNDPVFPLDKYIELGAFCFGQTFISINRMRTTKIE
jgi:hypothetical protein